VLSALSARIRGWRLNPRIPKAKKSHPFSKFGIAISKETDPAIAEKWNRALDQVKREAAFWDIFKNPHPNIDPHSPTMSKFE
jgi:hypothetical protein